MSRDLAAGLAGSAVFIDTSAWVGLLSRDDTVHSLARRQYEALQGRGVRLVTSNYIVDETATRLRYDLGLRQALAFRDLVVRAEERRRLRVVWVTSEVEREGWDVLAKYADVRFSLTDAITIAIARRLRIRAMFAFDQGFAAAGLALMAQR